MLGNGGGKIVPGQVRRSVEVELMVWGTFWLRGGEKNEAKAEQHLFWLWFLLFEDNGLSCVRYTLMSL